VPRIGECPIHFEAIVRNFFEIGARDERVAAGATAVEVQVVRMHVAKDLSLEENYINPSLRRPLIYNFRHYYGLGKVLGKTFRAEVQQLVSRKLLVVKKFHPVTNRVVPHLAWTPTEMGIKIAGISVAPLAF
jgi:hypothetical protein